MPSQLICVDIVLIPTSSPRVNLLPVRSNFRPQIIIQTITQLWFRDINANLPKEINNVIHRPVIAYELLKPTGKS